MLEASDLVVPEGLDFSGYDFTLAGEPPGCYAGPTPGTRTVAVASPLQRGLDVRLVQLALSDAGEPVKADGVFGDQSSKSLARVQTARGKPATGSAAGRAGSAIGFWVPHGPLPWRLPAAATTTTPR